MTSKKNGNSIFLPASGFRTDKDPNKHGSYGYYWSSTLRSDFTSRAYFIAFNNDRSTSLSLVRYNGYTVRPVAKP